MWSEFFIACCAGTLFLVAPGFLILRVLGFTFGRALCAAPLFSSVLISLLSIIYDVAGISSNPLSIVVVPAVIFVMFAIVLGVIRQRKAHRAEDDIPLEFIFLYAAIGLVVGMVIFVKNLDGPASFLEEYDEVHHLNGSQAFAESQVFSFFHSTFYTPEEITSVSPFEVGSFYPSGWQAITALLIQVCHIPATIAANVSNYLFSSLVSPLGFTYLLFVVFRGDRKHLVAGSIASVSFVSFPWLLTRWGPVYPNLAAFCTVPMACALFIECYRHEEFSSRVVIEATCFVFGLTGIALLQPNGVFTTAVMLGSFLIQEALQGKMQVKIGIRSQRAWPLAVALITLFGLLWFMLTKVPPIVPVVSFNWPCYQTPIQAIINFVTLAHADGFFDASSAQLLLATMLIVGAFDVMRHQIDSRWLLQSYAFWGITFVLTTATEGSFKHLLGGFWYTDHCRIAAASIISAIPLAAAGMAKVFDLFQPIASKVLGAGLRHLVAPASVVLFLILVFFPNYTIPGYASVITGFGHLRASIKSGYASGPGMIDSEEEAFLEEVSEIVPDGAIVANNPYDGSIFVYGAYDIHVMYRGISDYSMDRDNANSQAVRYGLADYLSDDTVAAAVDEIDIEYVLFLKPDSEPVKAFSAAVGDGLDEWPGLYDIDENTPGFTLILEEGDMRLFKLDEAA